MSHESMTEEAARRIQSHADRTGTNQPFKGRAQRAAERNTREAGNSSDNGDDNN